MDRYMFSISQLRMYAKCQLQWYWKYVMGIEVPITSSILVGKACHKTIEQLYLFKRSKKVSMRADQMLYIYREEFNRIMNQENIVFDDENPNKVMESGASILQIYHREIYPLIYPKSLEEHIEVSFESPVSFGFHGYLDMIAVDKDGENDYIVDNKTTKRSYAEGVIDGDTQLTAYDYLFRVKYNKIPSSLNIHTLVRTKEPKLQILSCGPRSEIMIQRFLKMLALVAKSIDSGIFIPCENYLQCASMCEFREHCKEWH